ncbi:hypothetical protein OU798_07260 [Prolixibacteraceae bacterium Z1-6]|uniref:Uncharacterized protein n=1 Tax=Draconibacterium aestuarii TaxID=2998507 RepID=A0A9X3J6Y8_9BACT|nr:hypothetical protein [Prolixibacteraceae bacterium Z1-6]
MEGDKFYKNIQKALEDLPENFSILEEQIDVGIQMKYFEFTKKQREKDIDEGCFIERDQLFDDEVGEERKKEILTSIAVYDDVRAYRTLEKYVQEAKGELKQWAILALQESRMLMHSSLLDEHQVFISTGLGGKGQKLRYYVVFLNKEKDEMLTATQQKLLKDELIFELKKHDGEFESMDFMEGFSSSLVMLPLQVEIRQVFQNVIEECNQYGGFLQDDLIITNVKIMSRGEIIQLIHQKKNDNFDELENEEN